MTGRHVRVFAPEFSEPWRARWHCAECGSVVAVILKRDPEVLRWADSANSMDMRRAPGARMNVVEREIYDGISETAFCPKDGLLRVEDVDEVIAALRSDPFTGVKRSITPQGLGSVPN